MPEIAIRALSGTHVLEARGLSNRNPDVFTAWVLDRLPNYFEISDALEDREESLKLERLALGAFADGRMIGAVSVGRVDRLAMLGAIAPDWEERLAGFSEHEVNVYFTLSDDWNRALLGPPDKSLFIHSLCVDRPYRGQGVATSLVSEAIGHLDDAERSSLYMGVARVRGYRRFCDSLGFRVAGKRFSLSDRLQFGCWGAALFRYTQVGARAG